MEGLGWGRGVGERWSWVPGGHVHQKQGRPDRGMRTVGSEVRGGQKRGPIKAGPALAAGRHGAWQGGGRQHGPSGTSLKEGRRFSLLIPLLASLAAPSCSTAWRGGSRGLCTFLGFRLLPPRTHLPLCPPPQLCPLEPGIFNSAGPH